MVAAKYGGTRSYSRLTENFVACPFRNGVLFIGRTIEQNTGAHYCHQTLGSKQTTTRYYVREDLRVNAFWYHFDDNVTYPSKMLDTELGINSIGTREFEITCDCQC